MGFHSPLRKLCDTENPRCDVEQLEQDTQKGTTGQAFPCSTLQGQYFTMFHCLGHSFYRQKTNHVGGYTATNPGNKQPLNCDLHPPIHIFVSTVSSCLFLLPSLLPKLNLEVCILSIKIALAISAGCEAICFPIWSFSSLLCSADMWD